MNEKDGDGKETLREKSGEQPFDADHEAQRQPKAVSVDDDPPPDGGLKAWLVVLGGWAVSFSCWGQINAFGQYQEYLAQNQLSSYSPSAISWLGSLQLGLTFGCAIFAGRLFDIGYMRPILIVGTIIYLAGLFGLANSQRYWQFLLSQGFANGLGCGILFLPASGCIGHWWRRKRSMAFGILATGSSCGGVLFPAVLSQLFPKVGFAWSVRVTAFITAFMLGVAHLTLRTRLPPRDRAKWVSWEYFRSLPFNLLNIASFLILWGLYVPYYYLPTYASQHGVSPSISKYCLSILNAGSLLGRLVPNYFADRYGPYAILTPHCVAAGILVCVWRQAASTSAGTIIFAICYGWSSGAFVSIGPACLASITPRANEIGIAMSMYYFLISFGVLTGNPIAGAIIAKQSEPGAERQEYGGAVAFAASSIFAGSAGLALNWFVVARRKGTWKV